MNLSILVAAVLLAAPADKPADKPAAAAPAATPAAPGMDMSKVGPASRKPKDEKVVKKDIDAFLKAQEDIAKKHDQEGMLAAIDFPVYMISDDAKGVVEAKAYTKDEYVAMMKPFQESMPKDMQVTHKYTVTILSDAIAQVMDDATMTVGKQKSGGKSSSVIVKKDGKWMWKTMVEAGWAGMEKQPAPAAAPAK
ncbi:MAG TPA: hypothetical protein VGK67_39995 [Myxococcales bacterium]|jgi:hypothetical protein